MNPQKTDFGNFNSDWSIMTIEGILCWGSLAGGEYLTYYIATCHKNKIRHKTLFWAVIAHQLFILMESRKKQKQANLLKYYS